MSALESTLKKGFQLSDHSMRKDDLALVSLRVALKSFFSTYAKLRGRISNIKNSSGTTQEVIDSYSLNYAEAYAETVVHFQHFAELICKSFLRNDHPLLSDVGSGKAGVLHSLLHNKKLTAEEEKQVRSIEFSEALKRLKELIKSNKLKDHTNLQFIITHFDTLTELNTLRNRVWHRGLYVLEYSALDEFVGKYVLPFVRDVVSHQFFAGKEIIWKYASPHCGLDPIDEIIKHFSTEAYNLDKVAYLKEIGRSAYDDKLPKGPKSSKPFKFTFLLYDAERKRAERIAASEAKRDFHEVCLCPTCGANSLIIHEETDSDFDDEGSPIKWYRFTHAAKCEYCGLSLDDEIGNAKDHGLGGIPEYFRSEAES
ncbi:hypothetical protein [Pseudomonas sp. TNT3]|uniref:hypothetical protein n=1 Tax=Pseudomonas sp. TNT3 TaxID=2654097 RepID=UPI0013913C48|nr:hypothetical protein [Pseudomonas sp. TNT3]KAI2685061.1 hypothetical protein GBC55_013500 [Pseudomonas sp. TNT3]